MRLGYLAICIAELFCSAVWAQDRDMAGAAEANQAAMSTVLSAGKAKQVLPEYTTTPGELKYNGTDLRSQAQQAMNSRFNPRDFHDVVLKTGSVPLDVLGEVVRRWSSSG